MLHRPVEVAAISGHLPLPTQTTSLTGYGRLLSLKWKGNVLGVLETRKHYGNYFKGVQNFKPTKTAILTERDPEKIITILNNIKEHSEKTEALI